MILILSNQHDTHTDVVMHSLADKGAECFRLNTETYPSAIALSFLYSDITDSVCLRSQYRVIDLTQVDTVWNRRPRNPQPDTRLSTKDQEFAAREAKHVHNAVPSCLQHAFWVNAHHASWAAEYKPYQLQVARKIGLNVPKTLISNDPDQVRAFAASCSGGMAYKTLSPYSREGTDGRLEGIFTNRLEAGTVIELANQARFTPCLFQEYVPKAIELRVTVIGDAIFTCSLDSQRCEHTRYDWRKLVMHGSVPIDPARIPAKLEVKVRELLRALGLVFGCLDFILTPAGEYIFLEINPNGQWYWVEQQTGLPLLNAFTDLLMDKSSRK